MDKNNITTDNIDMDNISNINNINGNNKNNTDINIDNMNKNTNENSEIERNFNTNLLGEHNILNLTMGIAVAKQFDIDDKTIEETVKNINLTNMRFQIIEKENTVYINDAYNANPSSMAEAIKALGQLEGKRKIAMLGDMLELGDFSEEAHREIGHLLAEEGYSVVFTFGDAAAFIAKEAKKAGLTTFRCNSHLEMANAYSDIREKGDVILVKGSRGLRMERVVEELKDRE